MTIPQALVTDFQRGRVIPFVGAGVSLGVKKDLFPSWSELLGLLADRLDANSKSDSATIVRSYCRKGQLLKAAEEAIAELGLSQFNDVMQGIFRIPCPLDADLSLPKAIWNLKPGIVATSNYESVLQWANSKARRVLNHQHAELAELLRSANPQQPVVWHLHGHIDEADSLILGPTQYTALYEQRPDLMRRYKAALEQLRNAAANSTFLFVGFGLRDPYVVELLKETFATFQGTSHPHFALLKAGEVDAGQLWEKCNVQVVEFQDFGGPQLEILDQMASIAKTPRDASPGAIGVSISPASILCIPDSYRKWLANEYSGVELIGLREQKGRAVQLYQVYVPLTMTAAGDTGDVQGREPSTTKRKRAPELDRLGGEGDRERKPLLLLNRLAGESLYVEGGAGFGKTTFCRWVAFLLNNGGMTAREPAAPEGCEELFPNALRNHLPLLVRLRDFWSVLPNAPGSQNLSQVQLEETIRAWLNQKQPGGLSWNCVRSHLDQGRLLLILDGFDEVPSRAGSEEEAYHPRKMLLEGLAQAILPWIGKGNRVMITSRPYGLGSNEIARLGIGSVRIEELDDSLRDLLIRRWFGVLATDTAQGEADALEMRNHVAERPDISPLLASPMLLTALCVIFKQGKRLPRDKHDLYDRIVDNILHNRYPDEQQEIPLVRKRLSVIAYGMHTGAGLDEERETPQAEATYAEIQQIIGRYRDQSPATEPGFKGAVQACDDLLSNSGLLLPLSDKRTGFYHFTFQDFLAAQLILEIDSDLVAFFRRRAAYPEWRSTLTFVFSSLMSRNTLPDKGIRLLETLIEPLAADLPLLAVVVADCLEILTARGVGLQKKFIERFNSVCLDAIEREVPVQPRCELGLALGRNGDSRIVNDLRDHSDSKAWIRIPTGSYPIGGGKSYYLEPMAKQSFQVKEPFCITRFAVTNAQFQCFWDNGGCGNRHLWSDEGWQWKERENATEPLYWRNARWKNPNQPVVGVSFWEAKAFCTWAGGRLPTEREWEAAARGPDGYEYPWGMNWEDGICNTSESGLGATSPVGIFPRSRSKPFGLEDMAGNVWEWCTDEVEGKIGNSKFMGRVVRGGSWYDYRDFARCVIRYSWRPDGRLSNSGFRVVCSAFPGLK